MSKQKQWIHPNNCFWHYGVLDEDGFMASSYSTVMHIGKSYGCFHRGRKPMYLKSLTKAKKYVETRMNEK